MSGNANWTIRYVADLTAVPIPEPRTWLTSAEQTELARWTEPRRFRQWLTARWIAKRMILCGTDRSQYHRIEILSRGDQGLGISPRVTIDGLAARQRLSISHSGNSVLVGIAAAELAIGVDLAIDLPQATSFRTAWFTKQERMWADRHPRQRLPILWGLKEAIFKSLGNGLPWNPRDVEVVAIDNGLVHSRICGERQGPLFTWIRRAPRGAATAVWRSLPTKPQQSASWESAACL